MFFCSYFHSRSHLLPQVKFGKQQICLGIFEYVFAVDDIGDDDIVLDYGKWSFIINKVSVPYINGMTLDYVKEGLNEFFKFINPKEQSSCGCGVSINFDLNAVEADEKQIFAVEV